MPHLPRSRPHGATPDAISRPATAFTTRPAPRMPPRAIVIAASTGGPQALGALLHGLATHIEQVPVYVVLHMPADFHDIVAQHVARQTGLDARVAGNGEVAKPGRVYFAPGGMHLRLAKSPEGVRMWHSDAPAEQFLKPAANLLFRSAAAVYAQDLLGVVLTGMGADGLEGSHAIVASGGAIMAQDEASSVVWGMPGAVTREGLACAVLSPDDMARAIAILIRGGRGRAQ
jgi:two-component system chemotaxis response regulator CheB